MTQDLCSYDSIGKSNIEMAVGYCSLGPAVDDSPPQHSMMCAIGANSYNNLNLALLVSLPTLANTPLFLMTI